VLGRAELLEQVPLLQCVVTSRQILELEPSGRSWWTAAGPGAQAFRPGTRGAGDGVREAQTADLNARMPQRLNALLQNESVALFVDRAQRGNAGLPAHRRERGRWLRYAGGWRESRSRWSWRLPGRSGSLRPGCWRNWEQRFDLLVSRKRDLPSRHQTLRARSTGAITSLAELQQFFAGLFPFRGGFTVEQRQR